MNQRLLLATIVATLALPATAWAKHDYEYAMALATKKRYYDMAKAEFQRLIESGDPNLAVKGKFGLTKILVIQARREQDPAKKAVKFDNALKEMAELIEGDPEALASGLFDLGELYIEKAKFNQKRMEKESDKADELLEIVRASYDKAIDIFAKVAKKFEGAEEEELAVKFRRSTYYLIECQFEKAITYKLGDKTRNGILKGLQTKIEAFCWDYEDYIEAYYAYTILGQAMANLIEKKHPKEEDLDDAFAAFNAALAIPVNPVTEFCRTLAYSRYMAECNRFKFYDRTLKLAKKMRKEYPGIEDLRFGQYAVIEEAKAYHGKREMGTALAIVGKIAVKRSAAGSQAQLLLGKWQGQAGVAQSASEAFLVAEGFRREREWWKALKGYQGTIVALGRDDAKPADKEKYEIAAWEWSAFCYQRLGLAYESHHALMAACRAAQRLKKNNKAAENAYYAFRAIKRRAAQSKFQGDDELSLAARKFFLDNFKGTPYEPGIRIEQARDMEEDKKFAQAIAAYQAIPKETEFYEEALSRIGICYYRQMKDQAQQGDDIGAAAKDSGRKALEAIDAYMAYVKKNKAVNEGSAQRRAGLVARVVYNRGSVHDKLGEPEKLLKVLEGYETEHKDAQPDLIGAAILLRIKAHVTMSDAAKAAGKEEERHSLIQKAEREMPRMVRATNPNSRYVAYGNQRVGFAWIGVANDMGEKDKEGSARFKRRAMKYLVPWALKAQKPNLTYAHIKFIALICYILGPKEGDPEYLGHATRLLDRAVKLFPDEIEKDKEINLKPLLAECYFKSERWAPALSLLRSEYSDNPRSLFALRGLGRCYYELGAKDTITATDFHAFITNSQKEDSALIKASAAAPADKKNSFKKDCVRRASQLYEFVWETSNKGKDFKQEDHKTFQEQLMAKSAKEALADTKTLINQFYYLKLQQQKRLASDPKALTMQAKLFAMDRSLYYYRTVAAKVKRLEDHWWNAKFYVIAATYEKGRAYHTGAAEAGDKTYVKGSKLLRHARKLIANLKVLYPSMGGPKHKDRFSELNDKIKEQLGG